MTFGDIFKSSFLENVSEFSILDTLIGMAFALAIGLFIYLIYKKTFSGVMYSSGFALALPGLSLGMVGALSIVRFRAAIKEPMEIVYLFWALAVGIVIGAGMIPLAVIGSVIIGLVLLLFANRKSRYNPYILVLRCRDELAEENALTLVRGSVGDFSVKSKTVGKDGIELTAELRIKEQSTDFVNRLCESDGVDSAVLVSYNGDYLS